MKSHLIIAGLALIGLPASAQTTAPAAAPPPYEPPFRIMGNTYSVGSPLVSVYLITTDKGDVLIDVGYAADAPLIEKNIRALGFKLSDIKVLLNNHAHRDHAGGLAQLKADTGAILIASEGDRSALESGHVLGSEAVHRLDFPPVKVDRAIGDGYTFELGGVTFTAHVTAGHTRGCTSWSWPVTDTLDGSQHIALDFCGATVSTNSLVPEQYPGIIAAYRHTFATAKSLPGDLFLAPHTEFYSPASKRLKLGDPGPNPFLDRAGFEALVDSQHALFETAFAEAQKKAAGQ
jgi:metallo-beta-lactamase class B